MQIQAKQNEESKDQKKTSRKTEATTSGFQKMKTNLCPESESVSAQKKRELMEDLVKGHEAATELRLLLQNPFGTQPSLSSSHHLIAKVLRSFTQALTIINSSPFAPVSGQNGPSVPRSGNRPRSGDCSEKRSKNGGRGRYNRRLTCHIFSPISLSLSLSLYIYIYKVYVFLQCQRFYCSVTGTRSLL